MSKFKRAVIVAIGLPLIGCQSNDASFENIAQLQELAQRAYVSGDLHQAEGLWLDIVKVMPEHTEAWCQLGHIDYRVHRYTAATHAYQKCLAITPHNVSAWHSLTAAKLREASETLLIGSAYLEGEKDQRLVANYQRLLRELMRLHGIAGGELRGEKQGAATHESK
ncbi:MAG: hypothetical protein GYB30_11580 [Gammaproteobacteria bacterium]|jgi:tetratricopeptide (TPR) repeat protein|nr:hypothetical protein [Gammaproteobacteria bacterium]